MLDKAKTVTPELARAKAPDMVWEDPFLLEDQLSDCLLYTSPSPRDRG